MIGGGVKTDPEPAPTGIMGGGMKSGGTTGGDAPEFALTPISGVCGGAVKALELSLSLRLSGFTSLGTEFGSLIEMG